MAAAAATLINTTTMSQNTTDDPKPPTVLHDFLGRPPTRFSAPSAAGADASASSSPSASVSGGRGGGPVSTTSDPPSERQVGGTLYEGVPFFRQKADVSGSKIQYSGSKRSHSDSAFVPQLRPDFRESSHLMKMLRSTGTERPRWPHEDESVMGVHQVRPTASSKWERAIPVNVGPVLQYPPRAGPYGYQQVSNRFKDSNAGSPLISQSAADEGSRTGMKGSGILSSVNVGGSVAEPSSSKLKSLISNNEPNASTPPPRQGSASVSRQMTIFYGGQAHVFDDVHPNKADVIMALAGSNGGSWSTSFLSNSSIKPIGTETISLNGLQGNMLMKDAGGSMQAAAEQKNEEKQ